MNRLFWICYVCFVIGIIFVDLVESSWIIGLIAAVLFAMVFGRFTVGKKIVEDKE